MALTSDESDMVLCAKDRGEWKLVRLSLQTGQRTWSSTQETEPTGVTEIKLADKQFIAVAYAYVKILFLSNRCFSYSRSLAY